jgi:prenyltransferase beta subunit
VRGKPVARAVRFLRSFQNSDGGFELNQGRGSDAQSTAWAIQGLVAAGVTPPRNAFAYLAGLKREDGSYRYSAKYVTTPVWVTSQVLAALAKKPFPLS